MPRTSQQRTGQRHGRGWRQRVVGATAAIAIAGSVTAIGVTVAQAQPYTTRRATVVQVVTRAPFGKMLARVSGRSLYIHPVGRCGPACLSAWPPLLMPRGKTGPLGTRCLGTAKFGHRLQVTYRGQRLYTFVGDTGTSVTGNNVSGFKVAKVKTGPCR